MRACLRCAVFRGGIKATVCGFCEFISADSSLTDNDRQPSRGAIMKLKRMARNSFPLLLLFLLSALSSLSGRRRVSLNIITHELLERRSSMIPPIETCPTNVRKYYLHRLSRYHFIGSSTANAQIRYLLRNSWTNMASLFQVSPYCYNSIPLEIRSLSLVTLGRRCCVSLDPSVTLPSAMIVGKT